MKKLLLSTAFCFCGMIVFSQAISDQGRPSTAPNLNQSAQNLTQSTLFVEENTNSPMLNQNRPVQNQSQNITKTAYLTNLNGKAMQAYPNPAIDQVKIQHVSSAERAIISLVSMDGRILQQRTVLPNTLQTQLSVGLLSKGIYILRFDDSRGDVRTIQLVKN